ncbi:MAG: hypothetical protein ABI548_27735 [Polyangiaceae bacterium]
MQLLLTQNGADDEHAPHVYVPPQPSGAVPQLLPKHAVAMGVGAQAHLLLTQLGVEPPHVPHV